MVHILKFCKKYILKYKDLIILHIILFLLVTLTSIITPYISGNFIDNLISNTNTLFIQKYIYIFVIIGLIEIFAGYFVEKLSCIIQTKVGNEINVSAIHHVQNLSLNFINERDTSYLNKQINNDSNMLALFCLLVPENIILNLLTIIIPLMFIFNSNIYLGLFLIILNSLYFIIYNHLKEPMYSASYERNEESANYFSKLDEQLRNTKFIQTNGIEDSFVFRLNICSENLLKKLLKEQKIGHFFSSSGDILKTISTIIVFTIGGFSVISETMSLGEFTIVFSYFVMCTSAIQYFFSLGEEIQQNRVYCDRLESIFEEKIKTNGKIFIEKIEKIDCKNVSFNYGNVTVINNLNINLSRGKIYSLIGRNGAGKSTLLNLILGIYVDEYNGLISYNDIPLNLLDIKKMREKVIAVSEQEPLLLPETLSFNLTLRENTAVDIKEFNMLCEILNIKQLISSLPKGLDSLINDQSSNISGGEKQKISIIRALLKHPQILILDEPTSAMDKKSKINLCNYLNSIKKETIIILSTHDEELLEICDETICINKD